MGSRLTEHLGTSQTAFKQAERAGVAPAVSEQQEAVVPAVSEQQEAWCDPTSFPGSSLEVERGPLERGWL